MLLLPLPRFGFLLEVERLGRHELTAGLHTDEVVDLATLLLPRLNSHSATPPPPGDAGGGGSGWGISRPGGAASRSMLSARATPPRRLRPRGCASSRSAG